MILQSFPNDIQAFPNIILKASLISTLLLND